MVRISTKYVEHCYLDITLIKESLIGCILHDQKESNCNIILKRVTSEGSASLQFYKVQALNMHLDFTIITYLATHLGIE